MVLELIDKWVKQEPFTHADILTMLIEYSRIFGNRTVTPEEANLVTQVWHGNWNRVIYKAMRDLGIIYNANIAEIYDQNGKFIARYYNKPNKE